MRGLCLGVFAVASLAFQVSSAVFPQQGTDLVIEWGCLATTLFRPATCRSAIVQAGVAAAAVAPSSPSNLSSAVSGRSVTLQWSRPGTGDPVDSYVVEAGSSPGLTDLANFDTGSAAQTLTVGSVPAGTYFVRVRARNSGGVSAASNEIVVRVVDTAVCASIPAAPTALTGSAVGASVTLNWTAPSGGCAPTGYIIEAGSVPGQSNLASFNTGSSATSYSASGIPSGTYYVRVRAANAAGRSAASNEVTLAIASGQGQWISIGPTPPPALQSSGLAFPNGRVAAIAIDPTDQNHWFIGAGNGGVWETRNAGTSFVPLSDGWPTLAIGAVAFAPSAPRTIYVGTGEPDSVGFEHAGVGIMKSIDGGQTWMLLGAPGFARASVKRVRVHPAMPDVVLAATVRSGLGRDAQEGNPSPPPFGILKSVDGGVTWSRTLAGQATALEIDPGNFNNAFAAIGEQRVPGGINNDSADGVPNGLYRSADGGQTWAPVSGPWGGSTPARAATGRIEVAIAPSNPNVIYASMQIPPNGGSSATGLLGLYRTDNAWAATPTWIQIPTDATGSGGYCNDQCGYVHVISVDPSDPNTLFVGGRGRNLWRCTNCGPSPAWINIGNSPNIQGDYHVLVWAANRLISGEDHGVGSTLNHGDTWQTHNATLSIATFYRGALHPTNPDFVMGGLRDLAGVSIRTRNGLWQIVIGQQAVELGEAEVAISSRHPDTDWMAGWVRGVIGKTTNAGQTWIAADAGIDKTGAAFVAPVRKCPDNDDVFLTGTNRMWRTDNFFGSTTPSWVANGPVFVASPNAFPTEGSILAIAFVSSDTSCNTYAFGNRIGQIQLTRDGGRTWTDRDPGTTLPARPVNGLAVDPSNPNILYVGLSSFDNGTPGKPGHVFKTINALAASPSWTNVSPPIDVPFNVITVDPRNPLLVYAGSDTGLWRSIDGAATWQRMGIDTGLPNASVYDIQINPVTNMTVVFTYGRGAYALAAR